MTYEEWHAFIAAHLPDPVSVEDGEADETWFTAGDPGEVIVRLRNRAVSVYEFAIRWTGGRQIVRPRLVGTLLPRGVDDARAMGIVESLIAAARERRVGPYQACRVCARRQPPEFMHDEFCAECADGMSGTVH
jgi:hypothetical protein